MHVVEFFCYKVFELLKAGPEVHFLLPPVGISPMSESDSSNANAKMLIATKHLEGFEMYKGFKKGTFSTEAMVQLSIL